MARGGRRKGPFIGPLTYQETLDRELRAQAQAESKLNQELAKVAARRERNRASAAARVTYKAERREEKRLGGRWTLHLQRSPCSRCQTLVRRTALIQPPESILGMGLLCEPCWNHLAVSFLPQQERAMRLDSYYRRTYGIGFQEYGDLYLRQMGKCAICQEPPLKPLVLDHDHETGEVRGLLCANCNSGLGMFKDNVGALAGAIQYLARSAASREDQVPAVAAG